MKIEKPKPITIEYYPLSPVIEYIVNKYYTPSQNISKIKEITILSFLFTYYTLTINNKFILDTNLRFIDKEMNYIYSLLNTEFGEKINFITK